MSAKNDRSDLPVLLLYNLDPAWPLRDLEEARQEALKLEAGLRNIGHPVTSLIIDTQEVATALAQYSPEDYIVFNWCEGLPGLPWSDALVAKALETLKFAYTGAPPEVLATCQDKARVKRQLERHHFTTPRWRLYASPACEDWACFPAIVKPSRTHCSFGVTAEAVVLTPAELRRRIAYVLEEFQQPALVEDFIDGREFHVALWGNGTIQMLPPAEMDFSAFDNIRDRLCTYEAKFDPTSRPYRDIQLRLPAPLTDGEYQTLEDTAVATYRRLGCRDYARLDVRLRDGEFYVLDVNPNADLSSESSIALAADVAGYSFGAMGSHLVNLAAQRHPIWGDKKT